MASFADKVSLLTQSSVVGLGVSMAWDVGIFQVLVDASTPLTSIQIAKAKSLKERYVRELLGCLSTAELIQVRRDKDGTLLYSMDDDAKTAVKERVWPTMGLPGALTSRYSSIRSCIHADGPYGTRYSDVIQQWLDAVLEVAAPKMVTDMLESVPNLTPRLEKGLDALEVGAGSARLSSIFAGKFPNSRFLATEISKELVESNRKRWKSIQNLSFSVVDLCDLPESPEKLYDFVYCNDVIHDLPDPLKALRGIRRLLRKPDGVFVFVDIATSGCPVKDKGNMEASFFYAASTFLCVAEGYLGEDSLALGACWGKPTALRLVKEAGFDVRDVMVDKSHILCTCTLPKEG